MRWVMIPTGNEISWSSGSISVLGRAAAFRLTTIVIPQGVHSGRRWLL
jgi:hypothetical protein